MASFSNKRTLNFSKEEIYLGGLLTNILTRHEIVSISFINTQMRGKNKTFFVTFEFLKKTNFKLFIIGSDLKISQTHADERFGGFDMSDDFFNQLVPILDKDNSAFVQLKRKLMEHHGFAKLQDQVLKWSSNKFKFNLPFLLRNSHKFKVYMEDLTGVSYVRLAEVHQKDMRIEIGEEKIWEIVNRNETDLVVNCLQSFLSTIDYSVQQGTLQSCLDFGSSAIDKNFMQRNSNLFVINTVDKSISLKGSKTAPDFKTQQKDDMFFKTTSTKNKTPASPPQKFNTEPFTTSPPTRNDHNPINNGASFSFSHQTTDTNLSPQMQEQIEKAYRNGQTVVILGKDKTLPVIFIDNENSSKLLNLQMVVALKEQIGSEIEKRSFR